MAEQVNSSGRKTIAVWFGGRSVEHDVSVVSGLQALNAIDPARFEAFPVYVDFSGAFWCGNALRERKNYIPQGKPAANLERVVLDTGMPGAPALVSESRKLFGRPQRRPFDLALPAFHGTHGEDGAFQGLMEFYGIPYAGMRATAAAVFMDKPLTKDMLKASGINLLPHVVLARPARGLIVPEADLVPQIAGLDFPLVVKPATLGSSIGVARVENLAELAAVLPSVFKLDVRVIVEPAVANLVEYNIAVSRIEGQVAVSAIERPKTVGALLDFKEKYLSGGGGSKKLGGASNSGGMLSLTREINPDLPEALRAQIEDWARTAFALIGGTGAPRIDFLCNSATGEVWLNEVNATPGSFGYFLWEAARDPLLFTDLLTGLIEEGLALKRPQSQFSDPVPEGARLFKTRG